eukprot:6188080-Pleurochrysis_carterae.AAC.4
MVRGRRRKGCAEEGGRSARSARGWRSEGGKLGEAHWEAERLSGSKRWVGRLERARGTRRRLRTIEHHDSGEGGHLLGRGRARRRGVLQRACCVKRCSCGNCGH